MQLEEFRVGPCCLGPWLERDADIRPTPDRYRGRRGGLEPRRRLADMNMRAGCRPRHRVPEGNKGNPRLAEIIQQGLSFLAVRMERHIHGVAVVKVQAVMGWGLPKRADRQRVAKSFGKKLFDLRRLRERPQRGSVKPQQLCRLAIAADGEPRQAQQLIAHGGFGDSHVGFTDPALVLIHAPHRLEQPLLGLEYVRARYQTLSIEITALLIFIGAALALGFVERQKFFRASPGFLDFLHDLDASFRNLGVAWNDPAAYR